MQQGGQQYTRGQLAVRRAHSSSDIGVLVTTFIAFFIITSLYFLINYISETANEPSMTMMDWMFGLLGTMIGSLLLFGAILLIGMFLTRMQRQTMLGNSLQVEYSDYAWLREWANQVAFDLQMPRVEIFITQDPYINAYAFGFARPYTIVLQSGAIRYLSKEEVKVVVVHEMAHIKYGHTTASIYLSPFLSLPFVNVIGTWVAGFWQRRTELTADRLALMYLGDSELLKSALIKIHVGSDVASAMNETARQWLQYTAERPMNHLAQTFSTHPFLVRRISHIDKWKYIVEPTPVATGVTDAR